MIISNYVKNTIFILTNLKNKNFSKNKNWNKQITKFKF